MDIGIRSGSSTEASLFKVVDRTTNMAVVDIKHPGWMIVGNPPLRALLRHALKRIARRM